MSIRFITSDHHFGHAGIYRFTDPAGHRIRPWAEDHEVGDEMMISAWNAAVGPRDTVYHLGDVAITRRALSLFPRLNGRKILIRGNHDIFRLKDYLPHFADIRGSHKADRAILTHYPIHPDSIPSWSAGNIHGHIHAGRVMMPGPDGSQVEDPRYLNACVEAIGIAPVPFEELQRRLIEAQEGDRPLSSSEMT